MAKPSIVLAELVEKGANDDVVRELLTYVAQRLMDFENEQRYGADYGERTEERTTAATATGIGSGRHALARSTCVETVAEI